MVGSLYEVRVDWRVPGLVRRKTTVSGNRGRTQGWSGRSRSISRPRPQQPSQGPYRQPLGQPSRQHPPQENSQSQPGRNHQYPSLQLLLHDNRHASNDESGSEEDDFRECSYIPAVKDLGGRRGDATTVAPIPGSRRPSRQREPLQSGPPYPTSPRSNTAHPSPPQPPFQSSRYPTSAAPYLHATRVTNVGRGELNGRDKAGGPEPLCNPRGISSRPYPPRSSLHSEPPLNRAPTSQPAPREPFPVTTSYGLHHPPLHSGLGHTYPHAQNAFPRPQSREGTRRPSDDLRPLVGAPSRGQNAAPSRSRAAPLHPPPAPPYTLSSERDTVHVRSGLEEVGERGQERAGDDARGRRAGRLEAERLQAEIGAGHAYQAGMADRRRSIRKADNYEIASEERLSGAKLKSNLDPIAHQNTHTSGVSSHSQPPPPPYHTRPPFLGVPQRRQPPAYPAAAASPNPPPPPPFSAAPRAQIHRSIPTAFNARDAHFGLSNQEERYDGRDDRGDRRADVLEPASRNPYPDPADRRQGGLRESHYKRVGDEALRSANARPQLPLSSSRQQPPPPSPPPSPPQRPSRFDTRSSPMPGMPQQQQSRRPANLAAAYPPAPAAAPPASDSSHSSTSSSSEVPPPYDPPAPARGNANVKVPSTGPRGMRVGAAITGPGPESRPGRDQNISGYSSARKGAELPGPHLIKTGERATPPQRRGPAPPTTAPRPRNQVHTNATNTAPRTRAIGARSTGSAPRTPPGARREAVGSVTGGRAVANFPKSLSPRRPASSRWREPPQRAIKNIPAGAGRGSGAQKQMKREEPQPTLTQKIGYKLWVTALGCL